MLRRVCKADVQVQKFIKPDGLEICLDCWKAWMADSADRDMGVKTMRGLVGEGSSYTLDVHESQRAADNRIGAATDAMIDSLSRLHAWAIYKYCSIATSWRFPNSDFMTIAEEARQNLAAKLKNNCCTSVLF